MASASTHRSRLTSRQLLVSVQSAGEAEIAFQCRVPWVDLKNPGAGSLGQPATVTCRDFIQAAHNHSHSRISLALGELAAVDWDFASHWLSYFAVGKVGLAGQQSLSPSLLKQLQPFRGQIVPTLYADWERASALSPPLVMDLAHGIEAPYLLVDTYLKDGLGLFHWMSCPTVAALARSCEQAAMDLVIAGSLRTSDWFDLETLGAVTVGVRGAVCEQVSDRTSQLSSTKIQQWLDWCNLAAENKTARQVD